MQFDLMYCAEVYLFGIANLAKFIWISSSNHRLIYKSDVQISKCVIQRLRINDESLCQTVSFFWANIFCCSALWSEQIQR